MNAVRKLGGLAAASLLLSACASAPVASLQESDTRSRLDYRYMNAVEEATRTGNAQVRVYWVNPPQDTQGSD